MACWRLRARTIRGLGVRVLRDGAWGFSSTSLMEPDQVERTTREALDIARASSMAQRDPVELDDTAPAVARWATPHEEDPFDVPIDEKLRILFEADAAMGRVAGVTVREGTIESGRERKTFASTEGARIEQEIVESGAGIDATAVSEDDSQARSYPNSAGGQMVTGGFEAVRGCRWPITPSASPRRRWRSRPRRSARRGR